MLFNIYIKNLTAECTVYYHNHSTYICTAVNIFKEYARVLLVNVVYIFPFRSTQRAGVGGASGLGAGGPLRVLHDGVEGRVVPPAGGRSPHWRH